MAKKSLESIVFPAEEFVKDPTTEYRHWLGTVTVYNYIYKGIPLLLERAGSRREGFDVKVVTDQLFLPLDMYAKIEKECRTSFYRSQWTNPVLDEDDANAFHDELVKGLDEIIDKFGDAIASGGISKGGRKKAEDLCAESMYKVSRKDAEKAINEKVEELEAKYPDFEFSIFLSNESCNYDGELCRERSVNYHTPSLKRDVSRPFEFNFYPDNKSCVERIDYYISLLNQAKEKFSTAKIELVKAEVIVAVENMKYLLERV